MQKVLVCNAFSMYNSAMSETLLSQSSVQSSRVSTLTPLDIVKKEGFRADKLCALDKEEWNRLHNTRDQISETTDFTEAVDGLWFHILELKEADANTSKFRPISNRF